MSAGRELLFGILVVQLRGVPAGRVAEARAAVGEGSGRTLSAVLSDEGVLPVSDCQDLEKLTDDLIAAADGDVAVAISSTDAGRGVLEALGGAELVDATLAIENPQLAGDARADSTGLHTLQEEPSRYRSDREFSRGGMGRILLVHDGYLERDVALKELLPSTGDTDATMGPSAASYASSEVMVRFLREAKVTAQLEHPGIVPVYEVGRRANGILYYTMRLVRGHTLGKSIQSARGLEKRLRLMNNFLDLCQAISYAHSRGVVHRDIKPSNVLLGSFGETVVIDWGLAKVKGKEDPYATQLREGLPLDTAVKDSDTLRTQFGARLGTPHYMSPEQAEGRIEAIDERSDVFSLGSVLYEVLTGQPAFSGTTVYEILSKVMKEEPVPIRTLEPKIPPELSGICEKAMRKLPGERYASAAELAEDISRYQAGSLVQAYTYSASEVLLRYYRKHKAIIHTALAGAAALLVLGIYSYVQISEAYEREYEQRLVAEDAAKKEAEARKVADERTYVTQMHLVEGYIEKGDFDAARSTLWSTDESQRGWEWGHRLLQVSNDRLRVDGVRKGLWSPDGTEIAVLRVRSAPCLVRTTDGAERQCVMPTGDAGSGDTIYTSMAFSPDGRMLALSSVASHLTVWDTETLEAVFDIDDFETNTSDARVVTDALCFSRDGRLLGVRSSDATYVVDAATGGAIRSYPFPAEALAFDAAGTSVLVSLENGQCAVWDILSGNERYIAHVERPLVSADGTEWAALTEDSIEIRSFTDKDPIARIPFEVNGEISEWAWLGDSNHTFALAGKIGVHLIGPHGETGLSGAVELDSQDTLYFSHNGAYLMAANRKSSIISVWELASGLMVATYRLPFPNGAWGIALSPTRLELAAVAADINVSRMILRPLTESLEQKVLVQPFRSATRLLGTESGSLITGSSGPDTIIADISEKESYWFLRHGRVNSAQDLSIDGKRLVFSLDEFVCGVWDLPNQRISTLYAQHRRPVVRIVVSPQGDRVASVDMSGTIDVWDPADGTLITRMNAGESNNGMAAAFSRDGNHLYVSSFEGGVVAWDIETGTSGRVFAESYGTPDVLAVIGEKPGILVCALTDEYGTKRTITAWDTSDGTPVELGAGGVRGATDIVSSDRLDRMILDSPRGLALLNRHGKGEITTIVPMSGGFGGVLIGANGEVYTETSSSQLITLLSAPFLADLPVGGGDLSWEERFENWRKDALEGHESGLDPVIARSGIGIIARASWERICRPLHGYDSTESTEVVGISSVQRDSALGGLNEYLQLGVGDTIFAITAHTMSDGSLGSEVRYRRYGVETTVEVRPMNELKSATVLEINRDEALRLFRTLQETVAHDPADTLNYVRSRDRYRGLVYTKPDSIDGLTFRTRTNKLYDAFLDRGGFCPGDRLLSIQDVQIDSVETLLTCLGDCIDGLAAGALGEVQLFIERGGYQLVTLTYSIR